MAQLIQFASGDQALRLYNEQYGRRMEIGCAWGKIRVLVRYTCEATSTVNASGLVVGVSQGTTDMFRSSNTTDFIGACFGTNAQNNNWTYTGAPVYAQTGGLAPIALLRQGSTNTIVPPGGSTNVQMALSPIRGVFGVDIEKSNASFKIKPLGCAVATLAQTDYNFGNFMFNADNDISTIPLIGHSPNTLVMPYTGNFAFDSVNIDWNNGIQPMVINDILVVRFF